MAEEKVRWHFQESSFFQREREREIQEERGIQEDGAFKRTEHSRGRGEVCPGYLPSAFRHLPNGGLDQLDPMLGSGCCFVSPPNQ